MPRGGNGIEPHVDRGPRCPSPAEVQELRGGAAVKDSLKGKRPPKGALPPEYTNDHRGWGTRIGP